MSKRFETPQTVYCGFDPTSDSLHVGSLIPLIALIHMAENGHKIISLLGTATAMIGDPSGKSEGRRMLGKSDIFLNTIHIGTQIGDTITNSGFSLNVKIVKNDAWFSTMNWIDMLREVGSKLSVNRMMTMDSVKNRIDSESGISFLEFSYMTMQAFDFLHLARTEKCFVQIGGQDQWGNIIMGIELARKSDNLDLAGITLPIITKSDGTKFGKSESGNIWLDEKKTSVFDFFQFWRNTKDEDVERFLKLFTFLDITVIDDLMTKNINIAKEVLAINVTRMVHGMDSADKAFMAAQALFSGGSDTSGIPSKPLGEIKPHIITLLVESGIATSKTDAKRIFDSGGLKVNGHKVSKTMHFASNGDILLQFGKKAFKFTVE